MGRQKMPPFFMVLTPFFTLLGPFFGLLGPLGAFFCLFGAFFTPRRHFLAIFWPFGGPKCGPTHDLMCPGDPYLVFWGQKTANASVSIVFGYPGALFRGVFRGFFWHPGLDCAQPEKPLGYTLPSPKTASRTPRKGPRGPKKLKPPSFLGFFAPPGASQDAPGGPGGPPGPPWRGVPGRFWAEIGPPGPPEGPSGP